MAVFDKISGIGVASGFKLQSKTPLDPRLVVDSISDRDALVTENGAYEGMHVYVKEETKEYQLQNGVWVELNKEYELPSAGTDLGGVKTGGDVTISNGEITVTSVGGKTADEIGKVKDVTLNGTSILGTNGTAAISINDLGSEYAEVTASTSMSINGSNYYGFEITDAMSDISLEVYNSNGEQVITHKIRDAESNKIAVACATAPGNTYYVRKLGGSGVKTDGHIIAPVITHDVMYDGEQYEYSVTIANPNPYPIKVKLSCPGNALSNIFNGDGHRVNAYQSNTITDYSSVASGSDCDSVEVYYERIISENFTQPMPNWKD